MDSNLEFSERELDEARHYPIIVEWSSEDGLYLASAPDLEGLTVHGASAAEAVEKSTDAVANWIFGMRSIGEPIPVPSHLIASR